MSMVTTMMGNHTVLGNLVPIYLNQAQQEWQLVSFYQGEGGLTSTTSWSDKQCGDEVETLEIVFK